MLFVSLWSTLCIKVELIKGLYHSWCSWVHFFLLRGPSILPIRWNGVLHFRYAGCSAQEVTHKLHSRVGALEQVRLRTCGMAFCQIEGTDSDEQGRHLIKQHPFSRIFFSCLTAGRLWVARTAVLRERRAGVSWKLLQEDGSPVLHRQRDNKLVRRGEKKKIPCPAIKGNLIPNAGFSYTLQEPMWDTNM